jgi:hypothetical protein
VGAEVNDRHALLVSEEKEGGFVVVKAWDKPQTQRVVAVARVLDHPDHLPMLSVNDVHVEIHIETGGNMVAAELDGRLYILLLEIHFIRINRDSDFPNVGDFPKVESFRTCEHDFPCFGGLSHLDNVANLREDKGDYLVTEVVGLNYFQVSISLAAEDRVILVMQEEVDDVC